MRPVLFGGSSRDSDEVFSEWVLVRYGRDPAPERFDLVVLRREGKDPIVKRVLGLPGESIRILDGDVFVDGKRLGRDARRPDPVLVFDASLHPVADMQGHGFCVEQSPEGPWSEEAGVWHLRAAQIGLGRDTGRSTGMMLYNPDVRDGYVDQAGKRIAGFRSVNDIIIQCEVAIDFVEGRFRMQLSEAGDLFEARVRPNDKPSSSHVIELIRSRVGSGHGVAVADREVVEASLELDLTLGTWHHFRFANVDNCVSFQCEDLGIDLFFEYDQNERFPGKPPVGDQNVGVRTGLGGEAVEARVRSIQVLRDLHYTTPPKLQAAAQGPGLKREEDLLYLGPEEIFLLGDNSSQSIDSRQYGALPIHDVVGRPVAVVWPFGRIRKL